jgi:hypothetical protein
VEEGGGGGLAAECWRRQAAIAKCSLPLSQQGPWPHTQMCEVTFSLEPGIVPLGGTLWLSLFPLQEPTSPLNLGDKDKTHHMNDLQNLMVGSG